MGQGRGPRRKKKARAATKVARSRPTRRAAAAAPQIQRKRKRNRRKSRRKATLAAAARDEKDAYNNTSITLSNGRFQPQLDILTMRLQITDSGVIGFRYLQLEISRPFMNNLQKKWYPKRSCEPILVQCTFKLRSNRPLERTSFLSMVCY